MHELPLHLFGRKDVYKTVFCFCVCVFVPVDGAKYFQEKKYVFMFLCFQKQCLWTQPEDLSFLHELLFWDVKLVSLLIGKVGHFT